MGFSSLVSRTISTPYQDNGRGGITVDRIVLHHMASTGFEGVLSMWINATRDGSANYAVSNEGVLVGAVDERNRSWSLANYGYDARAITFEIENEALGGSWPVSDAAHEMVAKAVADICKRWGIPCDRAHVVTHREVAAMGYSYSTACPGGLDADRIVVRANQIINNATPIVQPKAQEDVMAIIKVTDVKPNPVYLVAPGHIAHIPTEAALKVAIANFAPFDGVHNVSTPEFNDTLALLRIPQNQAYHFGGHSAGYSWSQENDNAASVAALMKKLGA